MAQPTTRRSGRPARPLARAVLAVGLVLVLSPVGPASPATSVSDTLSVLKEDERGVTNAEIMTLISEVTPPTGDAVMITRDDSFADALASGLLQRHGPLLAVPTAGPLPPAVRQRIAALGASRAVVLGGTAAVGAQVEAELASLGLSTSRLAGGTRVDTAVRIAQAEAPEADTVMLARAFASPDAADPTQAFADTLAAGGMSARRGWPVLLTDTGRLSAETAAYLRSAPIRRVMVLGGTAAISQAVVAELESIVEVVERVSGPTRFDTAVALEKVDGAQDASETSQVILIEGTSTNAFSSAGIRQDGRGDGPAPWAAGYASANRAFAFDAPILLTAAGQVPEATAAFLAPGVGGDPATAPLITCTMTGPACQAGRVAAGLPAPVPVSAMPSRGPLAPGQQVAITLDGYGGSATVEGSCLDRSVPVPPGGEVTVTAASTLPADTCEIRVEGIVLDGGAVQSEVFTYTPVAEGLAGPDLGLASVCGLAYDHVADVLFAVECNGASVIHRFTGDGRPADPPTVPHPFGATNDVDLDVVSRASTIFGSAVPRGSVLMLDGETAAGAIVVDPRTGAVLAGPVELEVTGTSVGVAHDPGRNEILALEWTTDTVFRLSATDGTLVSSSSAGPDPDTMSTAGFDVFFGDVEVTCSGSVVVVSSAEQPATELTADGVHVTFHDLGQPSGQELTMSALAFDEGTGRAFVGFHASGVLQVTTALPVGTC